MVHQSGGLILTPTGGSRAPADAAGDDRFPAGAGAKGDIGVTHESAHVPLSRLLMPIGHVPPSRV